MPEARQAPRATTTSAPSALNFLTVSGVAATRGSAASVSAAIAILMRVQLAASKSVWNEKRGWRASVLQERFGPRFKFVEPRFVRISGLAWMDDRDLAVLRRFHQLPIGPGVRIRDKRLFVRVIRKHLVVDLGAFIATGAPGRLDI